MVNIDYNKEYMAYELAKISKHLNNNLQIKSVNNDFCINGSDIVKCSLTKLNMFEPYKIKLEVNKMDKLISNTEMILKILNHKESNDSNKIILKNNESQVTTLRVNSELYEMIKRYSKLKGITITDILNESLINYLETH